MSKYLTNAAVIEFDSEVKHEYQGKGKLRQYVTSRTGVDGGAYKFTRMGKGLANQKATAADVTPMDISHARQTATLEDWNAPEYTDIFDQAEVNFDERQELAQTLAGAIYRREDQLIIDAMNAVTFAATNDQNPDTGRILDVSATANFSVDLIRSAATHFNDIEAERGQRHIALQALALEKMLEDSEVTSSDYATIKALVQGEVDTFMGFKFHVIGTRAEGGLPGVTGGEVAFAWHTPALGIAIGIDMKTSIDWVAHKTAWLTNAMFKAGAVAREPQGIVKMVYDETA
jgi:hypothetical protein